MLQLSCRHANEQGLIRRPRLTVNMSSMAAFPARSQCTASQ